MSDIQKLFDETFGTTGDVIRDAVLMLDEFSPYEFEDIFILNSSWSIKKLDVKIFVVSIDDPRIPANKYEMYPVLSSGYIEDELENRSSRNPLWTHYSLEMNKGTWEEIESFESRCPFKDSTNISLVKLEGCFHPNLNFINKKIDEVEKILESIY